MSLILSAEPRGRFTEGVIFGTPKPGTLLSLKDATPETGRFRWEPFALADGARYFVAVLLEQYFTGRDYNTAYKDGEVARIYFPVPGEELLVLAAPDSNGISFGTRLAIKNGGLVAEGVASPAMEPFVAIETVGAFAQAKLLRVMFTGN